MMRHYHLYVLLGPLVVTAVWCAARLSATVHLICAGLR